MALSALQLAQLALHGAAFLCGIICASALTVTQGQFGGHCMLYGEVRPNGSKLMLAADSPASLCYFVSAVAVVAALAAFSALLHSIYSCCVDDGLWDRTWLGVALVASAFILFFLMVVACILEAGINALCRSMLQMKLVPSCRDAQDRVWVAADSSRFYDNLYSTKATAWVNFFFWGLLLAVLLLQRRQDAPFRLLSRRDPEWSAETEAIIGGRGPRH
ncbi:transmembrane protein 179B isoform X2 [Alligator mississippiensis]|uniref:Transmembrane protein 179B isoform B n=1 Tax=Alligator mississippiensis TaxID=8496 RepID=A0A151M3Z9_ALLMI|nr:transmembrane protein 179B isoform X2 [Alligator mississippiensis]KYO19237.1 transmembrane protein 179B isoform B [Alligator mississippiensis]